MEYATNELGWIKYSSPLLRDSWYSCPCADNATRPRPDMIVFRGDNDGLRERLWPVHASSDRGCVKAQFAWPSSCRMPKVVDFWEVVRSSVSGVGEETFW